jgi:hypothetical protein
MALVRMLLYYLPAYLPAYIGCVKKVFPPLHAQDVCTSALD